MARREERAYREYVSDEQRSQPRGPQRGSRVGVEEGCPARELCDESLLQDTSEAIENASVFAARDAARWSAAAASGGRRQRAAFSEDFHVRERRVELCHSSR